MTTLRAFPATAWTSILTLISVSKHAPPPLTAFPHAIANVNTTVRFCLGAQVHLRRRRRFLTGIPPFRRHPPEEGSKPNAEDEQRPRFPVLSVVAGTTAVKISRWMTENRSDHTCAADATRALPFLCSRVELQTSKRISAEPVKQRKTPDFLRIRPEFCLIRPSGPVKSRDSAS